MGTPQVTAPPCAPSSVPGDATPSSGVIHVNFRHAAGFTVIGNHLAQHRGLSLAAIGLAAHIQSLPTGARIGIKHLAERFPESEPFVLAIEAQGKKDPRKTASWPYCVTYLHNRYGLPVLLLVVCQDRATAEWAARPIAIGVRPWQTLTLNPLVAGPHNMPVITDVAEARKDLALATLAAITHADNPDVGAILKTLSAALRDTPETIADPIVELTAQGLGNRPAAQHWRNLVAVDTSFYKSFMSEEIRDEGRAQGRAQGRTEDILLVLEQRGITVPDKVRERITDCGDPETLRQWLMRAVTAASAEEIFAEK
ncbi:hypothetical protein OH786_13540 [Streptomyces atratus]|uniref:hypothetical protein n=1 Tax=Streptomyces atratus TaxID=1893 RepID=UPI0032440C9C